MNNQPLASGLVAQSLRVPDSLDDKYLRGVVSIVSGSRTYPGAGVLSVGGALRSGAGMVRFLGSQTAAALVMARYPEIVLRPGQFQAAVVGSGWGMDLSTRTGSIIAKTVREGVPLIVDAGALRYVVEGPSKGNSLRVLTPHLGEAARLFARLGHPGEASTSAENQALRLAELTGSVVVLKGSTTYVADNSGNCIPYFAPTGWGGVAGAGDVLAAVIGTIVACRFADWKNRGSGFDLTSATAAAVWIHGNAVALASNGGPVIATDISTSIPIVIRNLLG